MNILAIETSCDETGIAILTEKNGKPLIIANQLTSQIKYHTKHGGVVPEIASRMHTEVIHSLIEKALTEASLTFQDLTHIAVTHEPGLEGALLIGRTTAKTLATVLNLPLIRINHLHGHLYAHFLTETPPTFPLICLIASGGHTQLIHAKDHFDFIIVGQTRDDAAGEAFDKIARHLGLGYPGGPKVEVLAKTGNPKAYHFPRPMKHDGLDFSFSGLKTAVIQATQSLLPLFEKEGAGGSYLLDICASFQQAVIDTLVRKSLLACEQYHCETLLIAGGVTANKALTAAFEKSCEEHSIKFYAPPLSLCTDNAAMIAAAAYFRLLTETPCN